MPDPIYGTARNRTKEVIRGTAGNDDIYPLGGWDVVEAGAGLDTVYVAGRAADYRVNTLEGVTYIDSLSGASAGTESAQLIDVEYIRFEDRTLIDLTKPMVFKAGAGNETFVGNAGIDTVVFAGPKAAHKVERLGDSVFVSDLIGTGGSDRLRSVERLEFSDGKLALDLSGNARDAARLVGCLLGPGAVGDTASSANLQIMGVVLALRDSGKSVRDLASLAVAALALPNAVFFDLLFNNVVGRKPSAAESASLLPLLEQLRQEEFLTQVVEAGLADGAINLVGLAKTGVWFG